MKVRELITVLAAMPPDLEVVVDDADTNWAMDGVEAYTGYVQNDSEQLCVIKGGGYGHTARGKLA